MAKFCRIWQHWAAANNMVTFCSIWQHMVMGPHSSAFLSAVLPKQQLLIDTEEKQRRGPQCFSHWEWN
jgi:hypothetical protein